MNYLSFILLSLSFYYPVFAGIGFSTPTEPSEVITALSSHCGLTKDEIYPELYLFRIESLNQDCEFWLKYYFEHLDDMASNQDLSVVGNVRMLFRFKSVIESSSLSKKGRLTLLSQFAEHVNVQEFDTLMKALPISNLLFSYCDDCMASKVRDIFNLLPKWPYLKQIKTGGFDMNESLFKLLADVLPRTSIEDVLLSDNIIDLQGLSHLIQMDECNVKRLDLGQVVPYSKKTLLAEPVAKLISELIMKRRLKSLQVDIDALGLPILAKALVGSGLESLSLSGTGFDRASAIALSEAFPLTNLTSLSLRKFDMTVSGGIQLLESLSRCPQLVSLELMDCNLGKVSSNWQSSLKSLLNLQSLKLNSNSLTERQMELVISSLSEMKKLLTLELQYNFIGTRVTRRMAEMLERVPVQKLHISRAGVGEEGLIALIKAKSSLKTVFASCNAFNNACQSIKDALRNNTNIDHLDLYSSGLQEKEFLQEKRVTFRG